MISQEMFDEAQCQLRVNREKSSRNCKHDYLLRGHVRCRQCGRVYVGEHTYTRCYKCTGRKKAYAPVERCRNKGWRADILENIVWAGLEHYLNDHDLIKSEIERQRRDATQVGVIKAELESVERQLKAADNEQHRLLQWALKGFPEEQVEAENRRLNQAKETLKAQKSELERRIKTGMDAAVNIPMLERFIEIMQSKLPNIEYEGKRMALDMLGITVYLDGENVELTGTLDPGIVLTRSEGR